MPNVSTLIQKNLSVTGNASQHCPSVFAVQRVHNLRDGDRLLGLETGDFILFLTEMKVTFIAKSRETGDRQLSLRLSMSWAG